MRLTERCERRMESNVFVAILVGLTALGCAQESYRCSVDPNDECVFADGVTECTFEDKWLSDDYYWCDTESDSWTKCKICEDDISTSAQVTTEPATTTPVATTSLAPTTSTITSPGTKPAAAMTTTPRTSSTTTTTPGTSSTTTTTKPGTNSTTTTTTPGTSRTTTTTTPGTSSTTTTMTATPGISSTTTSTATPSASAYRCSVDPNDECVFADGVTECKFEKKWFEDDYYWCDTESGHWKKCKVCEDSNSTAEDTTPATTKPKTTPVAPRKKTLSVYKCSTNPNLPCTFPFKHKGETYNQCTADDSTTGQPWCSTNDRRITWVYCKICEDPKSTTSSTKPTTTKSTTTPKSKQTTSSSTKSTTTGKSSTSKLMPTTKSTSTTKKTPMTKSTSTTKKTPMTKSTSTTEKTSMTKSTLTAKKTTTVLKFRPRGHRPGKEKIPGPSEETEDRKPNPSNKGKDEKLNPSLGSKDKSTQEGSEGSNDANEGKKSNAIMAVVLVLCIVAAVVGIIVIVVFVRRRRNRPNSRGVEDGGSGDSLLKQNGNGSSKSVSPDGSQEMQPMTSKTEAPAAEDDVILLSGQDSRSEGKILS